MYFRFRVSKQEMVIVPENQRNACSKKETQSRSMGNIAGGLSLRQDSSDPETSLSWPHENKNTVQRKAPSCTKQHHGNTQLLLDRNLLLVLLFGAKQFVLIVVFLT